jgi:molybdate transport system regulatory protein
MDAARRDVLARFNDPSARLLGGPRTSMRNHLRCTVARLESAGARDPMVRVLLALAGGGELASLITRESAELLGLASGLAVLGVVQGHGGARAAVGARRPRLTRVLNLLAWARAARVARRAARRAER